MHGTPTSLRIGALVCLCLAGCSGGQGDTPTLAAAASLRTVMPALLSAWEEASGDPAPAITYGASGSLRMQVEGGAPIDGVLFASAEPVDALIEAGLALPGTRRVVATNRLVLIGPEGAAPQVFETLHRTLPAGERLAVGDPGAVPAGRYARDAFTALGTWDDLEDRLVYGGDVAAVLAYARRGEVPAAVAYATDARGIDDIVVLDVAEGSWAPVARTVVAVTTGGDAPQPASAFLAWVGGPDGQAVLRAHGFGPPVP